MNETKLRGEGGLVQCPRCDSRSLEFGKKDFMDPDQMIEDVKCLECGKIFLQTWIADGWEEVRL